MNNNFGLYRKNLFKSVTRELCQWQILKKTTLFNKEEQPLVDKVVEAIETLKKQMESFKK